MTTQNLSNPESLEVLTAMLNQTLIETGRFFRSGASLQSRAQLKRTIPAAHEQFHSALDNLSEQIFVAKAFLERDYEVVRARKAALRKRPTEDIVMGESEATGVPVPEQTAVIVSRETESKPIDSTVNLEQQTDMNKDQQGTTNVRVKEEEPEGGNAAPPPPSQDAGGTEDINFDSLLNNQGTNEFDLNIDFDDDNNGGHENFFSDANFSDPNTGTGLNIGNTESGHDDTGLATGGDAFDLELQKFSGDPNDQFGNNTEDIMGPGESSFDDLFMESENIGGNENGDQDLLGGDGMMQLNELDDSWFT
ncbi:hypothetical protein BDW59DRAFT_143119 [Aspergillus cavernicola]|uniref:Mediator of RNA polymerase II transcription subunit 11 n=1 Tax=Aspergillus cavernicola TaxID=176166 RepID=A0ABR4IL26_9EURO